MGMSVHVRACTCMTSVVCRGRAWARVDGCACYVFVCLCACGHEQAACYVARAVSAWQPCSHIEEAQARRHEQDKRGGHEHPRRVTG